MIEYTLSPSAIKSSTPVTVIVLAVNQSDVVKVIDEGETVPSLVFSDDKPIVTGNVGCVFKTMVNVFVCPIPAASVVINEVGLTEIPFVSLSLFVTVTTLAKSPE